MRPSVLPAGVVLDGSVRGSGDLVVRGTIVGPVTLDGALTVEAGALVRGEVRARSVVVRGTLEGAVHASEVVRLEAGAKLFGDVHAERISAASGALVRGRVRMAGADRMRRTVGGTLEAPFSSAGALLAPYSSAGAVAAPRSSAGTQAAPVSSAGAHPAPPTSPGASLASAHAMRERTTTPASTIRTQLTTPAPPIDREDVLSQIPAAALREARVLRTSAPEPPLQAVPAARPATPPPARPATPPPAPPQRPATPPPPHPVEVAEPPRVERRELALTAPPPAIMPALGRIRVKKRPEATS